MPGAITILDGPMGTLLAARGVPTPLPLWSAAALRDAPEVVTQIHCDYAAAGATVHTANTFRTRRRTAPADWEYLTRTAVRLARGAVPSGQRVAGSLAPIMDCYRPDLSPPDPRPEHREMARALAAAGVDLILCETFPHVGEALVAVEEAVATGLPVWLALTAGPSADLLRPEDMLAAGREAIGRGASAVLVNCVPARDTLRFVRALATLDVPVGAYANAGEPDDLIGWTPSADAGASLYADLAASWVDAGVSLVGGCCGTGVAHVRALAERFGAEPGAVR